MSQQLIKIGSQPNDGTGDTLREGADKINANFSELYQSVGTGYFLPTATNTTLGGVRIDGTSITITNGVISAAVTSNYVLPTATSSILGGVKVDNTTITVNGSGVISSVIPTASTSIKGGVKVDGTTIVIDGSGVISVADSGASVTTGATAPSSPAVGDLWYDTVGGRTYVYFDASWVDANPVQQETISLSVLQQVVADSTDFADFQIRIAAL